MKKVFLLFVAIIGFSAMSSNVSAQTFKTTEKATVKTEKAVATPGNFVDKDKNGICDKHEVKGGKGCCDKQAGKANCNGKGKANCTAKEQQGKSCENDKAKSCGNHKGSCNGCKHGQTK